MKSMFFVVLFSLWAAISFAETNTELDKVTAEFSKAMGIETMLAETFQQTRVSLQSSMFDLSANLKAQLPNLSDEQEKELDEIFSTYINFILNSVDVEKAAHIYAKVIADGLPEQEIKNATAYYNSPEGKKLLKVVGAATAELNQYILSEMGEATQTAQVQMMKSLGKFRESVSADQAK